MAFVVVYDANVLYPSTLRDLLIRISQAGLVQAKWTNQIDLDRQAVYGAVQRIADSWRNPPGTVDDVLGRLDRDSLVESVAALRA